MTPKPAIPAHQLLMELTRLLSSLDHPRLEARLIVQHVLGVSREALIANPDMKVPHSNAEKARKLAERRLAGEPMAYLTGTREFFGLDLAVGPGALIPRPETELLVEAVLERVDSGAPVRFADLGAGSGAIGIALGATLPNAKGLLVDASPEALSWARRNLRAHDLEGRLQLVRADFTQPLVRQASLDVVVCNPPYVAEDEFATLQREVQGFEPKSALVPRGVERANGLELYPGLADWAKRALKPGGLVALEMGAGQGEAVTARLQQAGFSQVRLLRDLAGLDRVGLGVR